MLTKEVWEIFSHPSRIGVSMFPLVVVFQLFIRRRKRAAKKNMKSTIGECIEMKIISHEPTLEHAEHDVTHTWLEDGWMER